MFKTRFFLMISSMILSVAAIAGTTDNVKLISADELAQDISAANPKLAIYDANNAATRKSDGVIPGAKLLPSMKYDVAKTLPTAKDSKLVFYCANEQCMASHSAAQRAMDAGYKDVVVMKDGIEGWKKSGHPTKPGA